MLAGDEEVPEGTTMEESVVGSEGTLVQKGCVNVSATLRSDVLPKFGAFLLARNEKLASGI